MKDNTLVAPPVKSAGKATQNHDVAVKEVHPSNNSWVGSLSPKVTDSELKTLFAAHGEVIGINAFPFCRYAFVHFKEIEDANLARRGLQGYVLHGKPLVINFANPGWLNRLNILWVAGINQCVSKEELEKEFIKFGEIQRLRYVRDQNFAYIYYESVEDAVAAQQSMNGKQIGAHHIHVDFLMSQSFQREQGPGPKEGQLGKRNLESSGIQWTAQHSLKNYPGSGLAGATIQNQSLHIGSQEGDSQCSKVLLIRYPPPLIIKEHMLHSAFSQFGEIKRINTSTDMHCALVEFRTEEEASCARECLQGKLFNDPRISIEYSSSELGERARLSEYPYRPVQTDMLDLSCPVLVLSGPHRPDVVTRPITGDSRARSPNSCRRAKFEKAIISTWNDLFSGFSLSNKCVSGGWDGFRSNELHRESKRSRFDAPWSAESDISVIACGEALLQRVDRLLSCSVRCYRRTDDTHLPNVVNCSGRIRLDMLNKQYTCAIGFNLLLLLPDSKEDFALYTEFLSYLIAKDWAGVANLDDGNTLFLVPPSNFLTKVLNGSAPLRLHGVVLKYSEPASNSRSMSALSIQPQYGDAHNDTYLETGYNVVYLERRQLPLIYSGVLPKVSISPPEAPRLLSSSLHGHSVPPADVNVSWGKAVDHGIDASKFVSSSNIQQEACRVPLSNQVNVNDVTRPLPSAVECTHQNQQFQTAIHGEVHESTETEAEKNERYRAILLLAANLLSRVRQQRGNLAEHVRESMKVHPHQAPKIYVQIVYIIPRLLRRI
ncbi:UNVERIFIED_CONTAM: Flowering time control protein FPA [Sesamum calycinum]|uniref:Flowering time control protein FPA n=1 Tax=Sesamum calycinum TaxID=2727403 RepID=A0AAW2JDF9_9LAMI